MYAAVATAQLQPGTTGEAVALYQEMLRHVQQFPGFRGLLALTDPTTDKTMTIALYETEADARMVPTSDEYRQGLARFRDILAGQIIREVYEVSVQG